MKTKALAIIMAAMLLATLGAAQAYAWDLLYVPDSFALAVEPGTSVQIPMNVTSPVPTSSQMVRFLGTVSGGNLPAGWITSSSYYKFISRDLPVVSTVLTVNVPADTAPGVYSTTVYSWAGFRPIGLGTGFHIELTVGPSCAEAPSLELTGLGPTVIWPPNHSMVDVTAEGYAVNPEGCEVFNIAYEIVDEYGIYTGSGLIAVGVDGSFAAPVPVEASRLGQDKDGRHYTITVSAENEAGVTTIGPVDVWVPHDQSYLHK